VPSRCLDDGDRQRGLAVTLGSLDEAAVLGHAVELVRVQSGHAAGRLVDDPARDKAEVVPAYSRACQSGPTPVGQRRRGVVAEFSLQPLGLVPLRR